MAWRLALLAVATLVGCTADADRDGSAAETGTTAMHGSGSDAGQDSADSESDGPSTGGTTGDESAGASSNASVSGTAGSTDGSTSGSSGAESTTGSALPDGQWSVTELTYWDPGTTVTVELDDCTFCDATLDGGTLLVRYQQADGWTVWSVNIPVDSVVGAQPVTDDFSGAYVAINEANPDLPNGFTGYYAPTTGAGTLTLTQADIAPGGIVAGTLTVQLSQGDVDAALQAEFYAELPPG